MAMTNFKKDPTRERVSPSVHVEHVTLDAERAKPIPDPDTTMELPGSPEVAAEAVKQVSVEGRPAEGDAKAGPGRIVLDMLLAAMVIVVLSVIVGAAFGPVVGLVCLAIGVLALALNPVMGASAMRVEDRAKAARQLSDHPD